MNEILEKYYNNEEEYFSRYRYDENNKEFDISKEIKIYLISENIRQFHVSVEDGFDSAGYSCDMLCCAWIDNDGDLKTEYILLEIK